MVEQQDCLGVGRGRGRMTGGVGREGEGEGGRIDYSQFQGCH